MRRSLIYLLAGLAGGVLIALWIPGMQPNDRIVSYDGHRVFDVRELIQLPLDGTPGAAVIVEAIRDDMPISFVLPRGPLGISAGINEPDRQGLDQEQD